MSEFTQFNPVLGCAVDNPDDLLLDRLHDGSHDMMDPLIRHYILAAIARIQYLEWSQNESFKEG